MNKILPILGSLGLLCVYTPLVSAQGLVAFPTGNAAWTADITPKSLAGEPSTFAAATPQRAYVTHVEVTQFNKLKRARLTWSDGKTNEKWNVPGLPVTFNQDPQNGQVRPRQNGSLMELAVNASLTYDAFAFTWITPACLQEKDPVSHLGQQCLHYKGSVSSPMADGPKRPAFSREAWIDAKTLLPVELKTDTSTTVFEFQKKPPTEGPTPPAAVAKEIAYYKAVMGAP